MGRRKDLSGETVFYDVINKIGKQLGNKYINSSGNLNVVANALIPTIIGTTGIGLTYYITQKLKENEELKKRRFLGIF